MFIPIYIGTIVSDVALLPSGLALCLGRFSVTRSLRWHCLGHEGGVGRVPGEAHHQVVMWHCGRPLVL